MLVNYFIITRFLVVYIKIVRFEKIIGKLNLFYYNTAAYVLMVVNKRCFESIKFLCYCTSAPAGIVFHARFILFIYKIIVIRDLLVSSDKSKS